MELCSRQRSGRAACYSVRVQEANPCRLQFYEPLPRCSTGTVVRQWARVTGVGVERCAGPQTSVTV